MDASQLDALRKALKADVSDDYAADPERRHMLGGGRYYADVHARYETAGVLLDTDKQGQGASRGALGPGPANIFGAIGSAARSGSQVGNAVSALAGGFSSAVTGTASGFAAVGTAILGQILSPFGQSGQFATKLLGGLASSLVSGIGAAGSLLTAGLKIGTALAGGIIAGAGAAVGAGLGALIGTALGVGPLAGAVAGAGLFAGIASAVSSLLSTVGGAIGQALGAVGKAFGSVGHAFADAVGNLQVTMVDLIGTASRFATASAGISRNSGMSLGASGTASALAGILTGKPDGLNGFFSSFGNMSAYTGQVSSAFGIKGVNPRDFTSTITQADKRYEQLSSLYSGDQLALQRRILLQGRFGGSADAIGNLFSAGAGSVAMATRLAKQTALTPQETKQTLQLNFQLNAIQAELDRVKTKFLSDLMPAIQMGLGVFTKFFTANEGRIVQGMATFGQFLAVKFPDYLRSGVVAVFEFGKSVAASLPLIAQFGLSVYHSFASMVNGVKGLLAGLLHAVGIGITAFAPRFGKPFLDGSAAVNALPSMDPNALDKTFVGLARAGLPAYKSLGVAEKSATQFFDGAFGTTASRQEAFNGLRREVTKGVVDGLNQKPQRVDVSIKAADGFVGEVATQSAELFLRSLQDS